MVNSDLIWYDTGKIGWGVEVFFAGSPYGWSE
jgi:hypothetical protein